MIINGFTTKIFLRVSTGFENGVDEDVVDQVSGISTFEQITRLDKWLWF